MINKRLSDLSYNEDEFKRPKPLYENALKESGYKAEMKYETSENINNRNRHRKIIWFNPPFSQSVKTNIGKIFLKLVRKHFPRHHKLHKIFNPNTLKLSYCCMKNISNIIKQHNATVLATSTTPKRLCNCRNKDTCPLDGCCLKQCFIYKAEVHVDNDYKIYYGAVEGDFELRYNNHTKSFRNRYYEHDTELSKYIWKLKDLGKTFILKWRIAAYTSPYRCGTRCCNSCITEKYKIARTDQEHLLNKRTAFISKCRHRNNFS